MILWKIYYSDGSTFTNLDGEPSEAPALGVQCVVTAKDVWRCGDWFGLMDYLMKSGWKIVKFGRTIKNETNRKIMEIARNDSDFDLNTRFVQERGDFYWYDEDTE